MPMHLDISALHFPGNRWKQCIKAPRGNPGHPGIAEAWPGSGEQVGICSTPLIACRTRHPCGELGFFFAYVCMCVCGEMYLYLCTVLVSQCVTSLLALVRGKRNLLSGCSLVSPAHELQSRSLGSSYHLLFIPNLGRNIFHFNQRKCWFCVSRGQQN